MSVATLRTGLAAVLCLGVLSGAAVEAQVTQPPPRVFQGPPELNRQGQEVTLETDILGGFDDNLTPPGTSQPFVPSPSGYTGYAATQIRYWVGDQDRSLEARGGGFVSGYRTEGTSPRPAYGGDLTVGARANLGRNTNFDIWQGVRSDPYFTLGGFNSLRTDVADPRSTVADSSPISAITQTRSRVLDTQTSLRREWTSRASTRFNYSFSDREYEDSLAFDSRSHVARLSHEWSVSRFSGFETSYRYSDFDSVDFQGDRRPTKDHTLELGVTYGRNLSRTRRVEVSAGAGPVYVETIDISTQEPHQFWGPSGYGTARFDFGRSWTLGADYRRSVSVLQGLVAQAFLTDAASVSLGGLLSERVEAVFSGVYSNGNAGTSSESTDVGRFDSYAMTAQVSLPVTRWLAAFASYTHFRYTLNSVASEILFLPPQLNRNAVYVGFTVRAPLLGALP